MESGLSSLEKELKQWRENRNRAHETIAAMRPKTYAASTPTGRRVHVNGQEVLVVSKARR